MLDYVVDGAKRFALGVLWLIAEALGMTLCALVFLAPVIAFVIGG